MAEIRAFAGIRYNAAQGRDISQRIAPPYDILAQAGYDRVDTAPGRMDPRVHEAIAVIPTAGAEDGRILQELSPGYTRNGQLVHPARVTVAKGRPTRTGAGHENPRDGRIPHAVSEADGG